MADHLWRRDHNSALGEVNNKYVLCINEASVGSRGIWLHQNPLHYSTPILLLQLFISSTSSMFFDFILQPLGQTTTVSHFLGGLLFGPSFLGHDDILGATLFPARGTNMFETAALFGLLFFLFLSAVKGDGSMMLRPERAAIIVGGSIFLTSTCLNLPLAIFLQKSISMPSSLSDALPLIALSQGLIPFPSVALVLTELKILNSDLGKLATSACMFCNMLGILVIVLTVAVISSKSTADAVLAVSSVFALVFGCVFIFRPIVTGHILRRAQQGELREVHIVIIFIFVMLSGLFSELIGQTFVLGPLVFGLTVPDGPPLGSAVVDKLHFPIVKIFYPIYLTASGLRIDIFTISWQPLWVIGCIFAFSIFVKIGTVLLVACFVNLTVWDAVIVGIMFNSKGIMDLVVFNMWVDDESLTTEQFALSVLMMIIITGTVAPLLRHMYNPTKRLRPMRRRTIQHVKHGEELRILICIHNEDNVPSLKNLLEASNATEYSHLAVIGVILVELIGRIAPQLIAHHHSDRATDPTGASGSSKIVNALRSFESYKHGLVHVQAYTSVSPYDTMDDDVCRLALDQHANIVIIPFHKSWGIDGNVNHVNRNLRAFNLKVMEKVPCSVGVLVDRGTIKGSYTISNTNLVYHVAVIYIGGVDDIESVCYGSRMATHGNVTVTIFRFLLFGRDTARERKFDNNLIDEIRQINVGNHRFMYEEEVVRDGEGLASSLRRIEQGFDLIIVGMHHAESPLMKGLDAWSECEELGVIGDMLASPDIETTTSLLVVRQQRLHGKLATMKPAVVDTQFHGVRRLSNLPSGGSVSSGSMASNNSWTISVNSNREY